MCHSTDIDWWVRIIGFLRPISSYSRARQIEVTKEYIVNMNEEVKINFGPMFGNLTVAFIVLKLCKVIDWSWWWVLSPFWGVSY